ncbi:hypothetical protein BHE74_00004290 [Ensete ventricosum]|nr:hypothetical protein BHE74_00004290 [Ensete ventricosum]
MPNPWKKSRAGGGGGVIQFLAKLRLPDQGGSLIIKNRDSLRKPSRKKKLPPSNLDSSAFDPVTTPVMATPSNDGIRPDTTFANWPIPVTEDGCSLSLISTEIDSKRLKIGLGFF